MLAKMPRSLKSYKKSYFLIVQKSDLLYTGKSSSFGAPFPSTDEENAAGCAMDGHVGQTAPPPPAAGGCTEAQTTSA